MTTFLFSLLTTTAGSERMAQIDPHGWTLTLISVCVVFCALVILYFVYSFSGNIFSGKYSRKDKDSKPKKVKAGKGGDEAEVAAAIAMALEAHMGTGETEAAIATALHLYLCDAVHDWEPGIITIRRSAVSGWNNKQSNFRKSPR